MALSLVLASCAGEEEEEEEVTVPTEEEEVVIPTEEEEEVAPPGGNWWDKFGKPEYGGTITITTWEPRTWDPYRGLDGIHYMYLENLTFIDWTLDREIYAFSGWFTPMDRYTGCIAESWEAPDDSTIIFHIRPGIHWQDIPPVNGRELTAADVAWSFNRQWGCGDGFTEISPYIKQTAWECFQKIYATDKYTMVVEHTDPFTALEQILQPFHTHIQCRDMVEAKGDLIDWENAVGTGPWILDDYVTAASITFRKNENYWGWDERYPENQLPYADGVKMLIIPDPTTAYSALRTGKIDLIGGVGWEQAEQFLETNPELQSRISYYGAYGLRPRIDKEPFTDIRVRKAMNLAIDRETMAETLYGGYVEGKPVPQLGPDIGGYYTPFEEWPKDLQEEYIYNPEKARQLLAEAGYPNGFKTNVVVGGGASDPVLVFKEYLADIGIDMEVQVVEGPVFFNYVNLMHKHDQMAWDECGYWGMDPDPGLRLFMTGFFKNSQMISDPVFDEMMATKFLDEEGNPRSQEEIIRRSKECDMYILRQHWRVPSLPGFAFTMWQPWFKGYSGENTFRWAGNIWAHLWIDQDLKESMGH